MVRITHSHFIGDLSFYGVFNNENEYLGSFYGRKGQYFFMDQTYKVYEFRTKIQAALALKDLAFTSERRGQTQWQ